MDEYQQQQQQPIAIPTDQQQLSIGTTADQQQSLAVPTNQQQQPIEVSTDQQQLYIGTTVDQQYITTPLDQQQQYQTTPAADQQQQYPITPTTDQQQQYLATPADQQQLYINTPTDQQPQYLTTPTNQQQYITNSTDQQQQQQQQVYTTDANGQMVYSAPVDPNMPQPYIDPNDPNAPQNSIDPNDPQYNEKVNQQYALYYTQYGYNYGYGYGYGYGYTDGSTKPEMAEKSTMTEVTEAATTEITQKDVTPEGTSEKEDIGLQTSEIKVKDTSVLTEPDQRRPIFRQKDRIPDGVRLPTSVVEYNFSKDDDYLFSPISSKDLPLTLISKSKESLEVFVPEVNSGLVTDKNNKYVCYIDGKNIHVIQEQKNFKFIVGGHSSNILNISITSVEDKYTRILSTDEEGVIIVHELDESKNIIENGKLSPDFCTIIMAMKSNEYQIYCATFHPNNPNAFVVGTNMKCALYFNIEDGLWKRKINIEEESDNESESSESFSTDSSSSSMDEDAKRKKKEQRRRRREKRKEKRRRKMIHKKEQARDDRLKSGIKAVKLEHGCNVRCLAFNTDGSILATGGEDGLVRLWNMSEIGEFQLPFYYFSPLRDHQDEKTIGSAKPINTLEFACYNSKFGVDTILIVGSNKNRRIQILDTFNLNVLHELNLGRKTIWTWDERLKCLVVYKNNEPMLVSFHLSTPLIREDEKCIASPTKLSTKTKVKYLESNQAFKFYCECPFNFDGVKFDYAIGWKLNKPIHAFATNPSRVTVKSLNETTNTNKWYILFRHQSSLEICEVDENLIAPECRTACPLLGSLQWDIDELWEEARVKREALEWEDLKTELEGDFQLEREQWEKNFKEQQETWERQVQSLKEKFEKEKRTFLNDEIRAAVEKELRITCEPKVLAELNNELRDSLEEELKGSIEDEIRKECEPRIVARLTDELRDSLEEQVKISLERELRPICEESVRSELENQLIEEVRSSLKERFAEECRATVTEELRQTMEPEVKMNLERQLREEYEPLIKDSLKSELEEEIREDVTQKVKWEIRNEREAEIVEAISNEIREEMKEGMRDTIRNELKEEMKNEVKVSLETELRTKYEPIIRSASEQELEEKRKTINEEMEQKRKTMDEEMEQKRKAIEQEMEEKRQQMEKKLEEERQQMGKNLDVERQQMEQNIQHQITNEYRTILEREVNDDIKEMRSNLETDLQKEIESKRNELEARLRDELTAQLLSELRPKIEQQLRSEIDVNRSSSSPMMISIDERENYEEKIKELKSENETIEKEHEDLLMCLYDMEEKVNMYRDKLKSLDALSDEESEGEEEYNENEEEIEKEEEEEEISSSPAKSPIRSPLRSQSPEKSPIKSPVKSPVKSPIKSPVKSPVKSPMKLPLEMSQNPSSIPFMTTSTSESKEDSFINAAPSPLPSMIPHHQISFTLSSNVSSPNPLQFMNDVSKSEEKINEPSSAQTQILNVQVPEVSKETQIPGMDTSSQNDDGWGFTDDWDIPEAKAKSPSVPETKSPTFKEVGQTTSLNAPTMPNLLFTPPSNNNNNNDNGWNTGFTNPMVDRSNPLEKEKPEITPQSQPESATNAFNNVQVNSDNKTSPNQENIPFDMNMANDTNDGWNVDGWDTSNDFMSFNEKSKPDPKENTSPLPPQSTTTSMLSPKINEGLKSPLNSATKPTSATSNTNFSFNSWNTNNAKSPQSAAQPTASLFSPKMNESSKSPLDSFINAATKTTSATSNTSFSFDSWNNTNNAKSPQPASQPPTSLFSPKMNESQKSPFDSFINAATKNTSFSSNTGFSSSLDPKNTNNVKSPQPTAQSTASLFSPKMNEGQKSPFDSFINSATKPTSASSNNGFSFDSWSNSMKSPPSTTRTEKKSDNEWGFTNSWDTSSTSNNNGNGWGFDTTASDKKSNAGSHHNYSGNNSFADSLFKSDNTTSNSFGNSWLSPTRKDSDPNKKSIAPLALGGSKFGGIKSTSNIGFGQRTPPSGSSGFGQRTPPSNSSGFMHRSPSQQTNDHLFGGGQSQNDSHHRPGSTTGSNSNLFGNIGSNNNNNFFSNQPSNTSNFSFSRYRG